MAAMVAAEAATVVVGLAAMELLDEQLWRPAWIDWMHLWNVSTESRWMRWAGAIWWLSSATLAPTQQVASPDGMEAVLEAALG